MCNDQRVKLTHLVGPTPTEPGNREMGRKKEVLPSDIPDDWQEEIVRENTELAQAEPEYVMRLDGNGDDNILEKWIEAERSTSQHRRELKEGFYIEGRGGGKTFARQKMMQKLGARIAPEDVLPMGGHETGLAWAYLHSSQFNNLTALELRKMIGSAILSYRCSHRKEQCREIIQRVDFLLMDNSAHRNAAIIDGIRQSMEHVGVSSFIDLVQEVSDANQKKG